MTKTRLAIRGYLRSTDDSGTLFKAELLFHDHLEVDDVELGDVLENLAEKHAGMMMSYAPRLYMVEIEFLDEPNPMERFFRFGTDPSGMMSPLEVITWREAIR